jgi:hypothetical protein
MNDKNAFETMLTEIRNMQVPIITVNNLVMDARGEEWTDTHLIIIPSGNDNVIVFTFEECTHNHNNYLSTVKSYGMTLDEALIHYGDIVITHPGSTLKLMTI